MINITLKLLCFCNKICFSFINFQLLTMYSVLLWVWGSLYWYALILLSYTFIPITLHNIDAIVKLFNSSLVGLG